MRNFTLGLIAGLLLGVPGAALAAEIIGGTGYLKGWEVITGNGVVCRDPYIWTRLRQIDCI